MFSVEETWMVHTLQAWAVALTSYHGFIEAASKEVDDDDSGDESDDQDAELEFEGQFEGE